MRPALITNNGDEFIAEEVIKWSKISIIMEKRSFEECCGGYGLAHSHL